MLLLALVAALHGRGRFEGSVIGTGGEKVYVAREGQRVRLRFVDRRRAGTAYQVVATVGSSTLYGLGGRTGRPGAASVLALSDLGPPSRVSVRWTVGGRSAARWVFLVRPSKRR